MVCSLTFLLFLACVVVGFVFCAALFCILELVGSVDCSLTFLRVFFSCFVCGAVLRWLFLVASVHTLFYFVALVYMEWYKPNCNCGSKAKLCCYQGIWYWRCAERECKFYITRDRLEKEMTPVFKSKTITDYFNSTQDKSKIYPLSPLPLPLSPLPSSLLLSTPLPSPSSQHYTTTKTTTTATATATATTTRNITQQQKMTRQSKINQQPTHTTQQNRENKKRKRKRESCT